LTKGPKTYAGKKRQPLQQMALGNWLATNRRLKIDSYISLYLRVQMDQDLNVKLKPLKLLEETMVKNTSRYRHRQQLSE
jgi:hypothetical protein